MRMIEDIHFGAEMPWPALTDRLMPRYRQAALEMKTPSSQSRTLSGAREAGRCSAEASPQNIGRYEWQDAKIFRSFLPCPPFLLSSPEQLPRFQT